MIDDLAVLFGLIALAAICTAILGEIMRQIKP